MRDNTPAVHEEEREEAKKHDVMYGKADVERLRMKASDWEKFDRMGEPLDAYAGSMVRLGEISGLHVLDAGCGDGWLTVILVKRGASFVDAFDISEQGVRVARQRAELNGVAARCRFEAGSFYSIPFDDGSADVVIGQSILHHLGHKDRAAAELYRVMKPGARAIFSEPFGNSLWLERLRMMVPVESAAPEDPGQWARQFKYSDLAPFRKYFEIEVEEFQFFSRLERIISWKRLTSAIARFDRRLLRMLPALRPFARAIVVEFRRPLHH
jgi:2-polyprenyl-3-methyl-5-hydroxy-6-metoxy-1,4-benzoquinol methylase